MYTQEMLDIKRILFNNNTFGKTKTKKGYVDSILFKTKGEYLYLYVRTKEFKQFFGDWENDYSNSSKVVDINGEPLIVYHGTRVPFDMFDSTMKNSRNVFGLGTDAFFFTSKKENAEKVAKPSKKGDIIINKRPLYASSYPYNNPKRVSKILGYDVTLETINNIDIIKAFFKKLNKNVLIDVVKQDSINVLECFLNIRNMGIMNCKGKHIRDISINVFDSFVNNQKDGGKLENIIDGVMDLADTYFIKDVNQIQIIKGE